MDKALVRSAVGMLVLALGSSAHAAEAVHPGRALYQKYCESCHGSNANGDGPVAPALKTEPPDLTQLAKKNGGTFPFEGTVQSIDGRRPVRAHGTTDMPVWGERFEAAISPSGGGGREEPLVKGRMRLIVDYLRTIQEK